MTFLEEVIENEDIMTTGDKIKTDPQAVGTTVAKTVTLAKEENPHRVACGLLTCANILERRPQNVLFGIMPNKCTRAMEHIEQVLLEAFFREHGIPLIKVDSAAKLADLVGEKPSEVTCVLVLQSFNRHRMLTVEENTLMELCLHDSFTWPPPVAELPGVP